ncbi:MAG: helix-turn-helix domain-containing protein [Deltaproteobacteria bacterium]|nr:helix-turn-helix domain-containing protein [Deltaproteobacteria bacterium]
MAKTNREWDGQALREWIAQAAPLERQRGRIVLARARGATINGIAVLLGVHRDTVQRWLARYRRQGLAGLAHRNGGRAQRPKFGARVVGKIRRIASRPPQEQGEAFAVWSLAKLRAHLVRRRVVEWISIERLRQLLVDTGGRPPGWWVPFPDRIPLSPEVRLQLQRFAARPQVGVRAAIVLAAAEGRPLKVITAELGASMTSVRRWLRRFLQGGVSGLEGRPGRGHPALFSPAVCARIVACARQSPAEVGVAAKEWSLYTLRQYLITAGVVSHVSIEWLRQILRRAAGASPCASGAAAGGAQRFASMSHPTLPWRVKGRAPHTPRAHRASGRGGRAPGDRAARPGRNTPTRSAS